MDYVVSFGKHFSSELFLLWFSENFKVFSRTYLVRAHCYACIYVCHVFMYAMYLCMPCIYVCHVFMYAMYLCSSLFLVVFTLLSYSLIVMVQVTLIALCDLHT